MADGKIVIDTRLDSDGIEKGISKISGLAKTGLKTAAVAISGVATALGGAAVAAIKTGSDFEAQMSRVKAISGATGDEFKKLTDQAIKLGADTAFSAKEVAEGMENLASAGFDTNEIMAAMPGMLDLAASSGEDLAHSSDIAASTLRGFGLAASDAGHVADVLAKNAADTNAAVADTGEAMKYVAPVAHSMGIEMEEVAAAIGIMADSGIKGSQAGTTLRGALSRLAKPTKSMTDVMDELGLSFYDSNGKMKSLTDITAMLQDKMSGLTDQQKQQALVTLFGQESLSGMLALMDKGSDGIASLTASYKDCDGAAAEMAGTMQDNLKGAIEELGGSAETLGIVFYQSVSDSLKKTVNTASESINNITDAFNEGGLDKALDQTGKEFADLSTKVAKSAPEMVKASAKLIKSFISGIAKNKGQLKAAAKDIVDALVDGLVSLLPKKMQGPVKKALDSLQRTFTSGMRSLVGAGKPTLDVLGKLFTKLADNMDTVAPVVLGIVTGFKTFKTVSGPVQTVVDIIIKLKKVSETAGGAMGALSAAMAANPATLVALAIAGLVGGLAIYATKTSKAKEEQIALDKELDAFNQKCRESADTVRETQKARQETVQGIQAEYGHYQSLWDELQDIVDQNGNVKEGYEERASFITGTLSEALGVEIENNGKVISNYEKLKGTIDEVIAKKKAQAIVDAYSDSYTEAIKNQTKANQELSQAYKNVQDAIDNLNGKEKALENLNEALKNGEVDAKEYHNQWNTLTGEIEHANNRVDESKKAYDNAKTAADEYSTTISNYEAAVGAVESGSADAATAIVALANDMKTASNAQSSELAKQVSDFRSKYEDMKAAAADGGSGVAQEAVNQAQAMYFLSQAEYAKATNMPKEYIDQMMNNAKAALEGSNIDETALRTANATVQSAKQGFDNGKDDVGNAAQGLINFASGKFQGTQLPQLVGNAAMDTTNSMAQGFDAGSDGVSASAAGVVNAASASLTSNDLSARYGMTGSKAAAQLAAALSGQGSAVAGAANTVASLAKSSLAGANISGEYQKQGFKSTQSLSTSIRSRSGAVQGAASAVGGSAKSGLTGANMSATGRSEGSKMSSGTSSGIRSGSGETTAAAKSLAQGVKGAVQKANLSGAGSSFGAHFSVGLASGIRSGMSAAISAAAALASSALEKAKNVLGIASPSKKTRYFGKMFDAGYEKGIKENQKGAIRSAENLSKKLIGTIDAGAALESMRAAMGMNISRVTSGTVVHSIAKNDAKERSGESGGPVNQTVNINQPVKSPVETAREIRKVGKELAFGR